MEDSSRQVEMNVIKTDNGRLSIYQCKPKITTISQQTANTREFNRVTVGDITNKRKQRKDLLNMVLRRTL